MRTVWILVATLASCSDALRVPYMHGAHVHMGPPLHAQLKLRMTADDPPEAMDVEETVATTPAPPKRKLPEGMPETVLGLCARLPLPSSLPTPLTLQQPIPLTALLSLLCTVT